MLIYRRFRDPNQAREALEKMNGFDLAGRPIRVGLGNDKFTPESTASLLQRFQGQSHQQQFQGSVSHFLLCTLFLSFGNTQDAAL